MSGHDFRTEGTCPPVWTFMDSRYIKDVYESYAKKPLQNFLDYSLYRQIRWGMSGVKTVRPLYYIDEKKPDRKDGLKRDFGWQDYYEHHSENIYTAFVGFLYYKKFGIDMRITECSAFIRSGYITKEDALKQLDVLPTIDSKYVDMVVTRYFGGDRSKYEQMLSEPKKTFEDYGEYFKRFRTYKWLFWLGMKFGIFPVTYYEKYTKDAKWFK